MSQKQVIQGQVIQGQIVQGNALYHSGNPAYSPQPPPPPQQQQAQVQYAQQPQYMQAQPVYAQPQPVYPQSQNPQTVIYNQPSLNPRGIPNSGIPGWEYSKTGSWRGDICDCCSISCQPACIMATCCGCIPLGQIAEKANIMPFQVVVGGYVVLWVLAFILSEFLPGYNWSWLVGIFVFVVCMFCRSKVREILHISGDLFGDCCCSFWCTCCTIAQMSRTVYNYQENDSCEWGAHGEPRWWGAYAALEAGQLGSGGGGAGGGGAGGGAPVPAQAYPQPQPQQQYAHAAVVVTQQPAPQYAQNSYSPQPQPQSSEQHKAQQGYVVQGHATSSPQPPPQQQQQQQPQASLAAGDATGTVPGGNEAFLAELNRSVGADNF